LGSGPLLPIALKAFLLNLGIMSHVWMFYIYTLSIFAAKIALARKEGDENEK
jgi:hypothetical protein